MVNQARNNSRDTVVVNDSPASYTDSHVKPAHRAQMLENARRQATENARLAASNGPVPKSLIIRRSYGLETSFEGIYDKSGFGDFGDCPKRRG
jgi:hypothetical protein